MSGGGERLWNICIHRWSNANQALTDFGSSHVHSIYYMSWAEELVRLVWFWPDHSSSPIDCYMLLLIKN